MKKLLFALAGTAAFAAFATDPSAGANDIDVLGFENFDLTQTATVSGAVVNRDDSGVEGQTKWVATGDDASLVKTYGSEGNATKGNGLSYPAPFSDEGDQYLALDTNGSELQRYFTTDTTNGTPTTVAADGTYIDTLVQFTPSESAPTSADLAGAKLAIWLGVVNNVTNLYVQGNYWDFDSAAVASSQTYALSGKTIEPGTWYRLTVKAIPNILNEDSGMSLPAFQIKVDGTEMTLATAPLSAGFQELLEASSMYASADIQSAVTANKLVPSIQAEIGTYGDAVTLSCVGFKGTGALDDFVVTTAAPNFTPPLLDFTLTWPTSLTSASYTLDGVAGDALTIGDGTVTIHGTNGAPVTLTGSLGYATKTVEGSITANGTLALTEDIGLYFPLTATADQDGTAAHPFEIADATGLQSLQAAVAALADARGLCYAQTGNIDMSSAGPFPGIGTYAANLNSGVAFTGTYDGQGYKISNIDFTQRNYGGIFNQVKGGTIKNLTVENITCSTFDASANDGEWGCAIVGNAGMGATLQGLVAMGDFGTVATPCSHNVAGIAIRVCGGASNVVDGVTMLETLVKDCTNNATLHGTYTKLGGISALTQDQNGVPNDYVTYDGCVNNGTITATANANGKNPGTDGISGIVAYTSDATVLKDCVNAGTYSSVYASARGAELVGYHQGKTLTDMGGNKGDATKKFVYTQLAGSIVGFQYATVDNGVATTTTTLAKDTRFLLEGNVAASETPVFTLAAEGDYIEFDTALGYTFAGTVAGTDVTNETTGTVIKYWIPSAEPPSGDHYQVDIGGTDYQVTLEEEELALLATAGVDTNSVAAVNAALDTVITNGVKVWEAAILGLTPTAAGLEEFKIDSIEIVNGTVVVTLPDGVTPKTGRGVDITIKLMKADTPNAAAADWTQVETAGGSDNKTFAPFAPGSGETKKFYKVQVDFAGSSN